MTVLPQLPLILIYIFIPIICLFKKKHSLLSIWLTLTCVIDIFNSQKYMNLSAFKLSGLILLPYVLINCRKYFKHLPVKMILFHIVYLGVLGIIHGHLFPWIDETGIKAGRDIPQWRSILHLGSITLEYISTLYLAIQFKDSRASLNAIYTIVFGTFSSMTAALVENITHFDIYNFFTASKSGSIINRMKGLNYEPRGFAQALVYGVVSASSLALNQNRKYFIIAGLFLISLFTLTMSVTGIIVLIVGATSLSLYYLVIKRPPLKLIFLPLLIVSIVSIGLFSYKKDTLIKHIKDRSFMYKDSNIIKKMEVLDASALNFLAKNPKHLLLGTGPGLVTIPIGTKYLVRDEIKHWPNGLTALPHMGFILQLSNGGILGVLIWILPFFIIIKNTIPRLKEEKYKDFLIPSLASLSILTIYLFQLRYHYYLAYAILLGFYFKVSEEKSCGQT